MNTITYSKAQQVLISQKNGVTYVCIPKGVVIDEDIEVDGNSEITMKEKSKATIIIQNNANVISTVNSDASLHIKIFTRDANQITQNITSHIKGESATSNIDLVVHGKGNEAYELSVKNIFDAKNGKGNINIRGVAEENVRMKIDGMIEITKKGSGTEAYLTEKILMLDHTAKVDAVPRLEIKTNDVKASHSATITKISEEDLFYFASRGISKKESRKMFVDGFLGEIVGKIEH